MPVRYNDLTIWEPLLDAKSVSGSGTIATVFTVPTGQIWEITSGGIRVVSIGDGGNISYLAWAVGPNSQRISSTSPATVAVNDVLPLYQTVWLAEGGIIQGFAAGAAVNASILTTIVGRKWLL